MFFMFGQHHELERLMREINLYDETMLTRAGVSSFLKRYHPDKISGNVFVREQVEDICRRRGITTKRFEDIVKRVIEFYTNPNFQWKKTIVVPSSVPVKSFSAGDRKPEHVPTDKNFSIPRQSSFGTTPPRQSQKPQTTRSPSTSASESFAEDRNEHAEQKSGETHSQPQQNAKRGRKTTKVQYFADMGEVFDSTKESYGTWTKRMSLKYFPEVRERHRKRCREYSKKRYDAKKKRASPSAAPDVTETTATER